MSFSDAVDINELYCDMLGVNIVEIEGAGKLLKEFNYDYEIIIATNDPKQL